MSSAKKRKLNASRDSTPLSAVAARRALRSEAEATIRQSTTPESLIDSGRSGLLARRNHNGKVDREKNPALEGQDVNDPAMETTPSEVAFQLDTNASSTSFESRAESPELIVEQQSLSLSTFRPSQETLKERSRGILALRLAPGERLVVLGRYGLSVQKGQVTLLGSTLLPSKKIHQVYASSSQALPVIRCLTSDTDKAEIQLHPVVCGLESLSTLSPLFGKLWNEGSGPLGSEYSSLLEKNQKSSFQILFSSNDGPPRSFLQPLISAPEWNEALFKLAGSSSSKTSRIMLCGPKSSGKSTFAKIVANRLLSIADASTISLKRPTGVAILDLDPGQPEYSPPGQISLLHIEEPNFGPPYSHPIPLSNGRSVRSHSIGAISPSMDPSLYMACALDLYAHYCNILSIYPNCPLVINTPGWVLGTGLEILVNLITRIRPTEVLYMSQDGPAEVVESLREAGKMIPLFTLPSQGSEYATRTAAHLRTMQTMSYFHLDSSNRSKLSWNSSPLSSAPPWQISYAGDGAGILGIMCYGEQPPLDLLAEKINGSLVAVVVIDDMAAIPGWDANSAMTIAANEDQIESIQEDIEFQTLDEATFQPHQIEKPLVLQTPAENIPYFNPANAISLNPKHSHTIGLALVRGIDSKRRTLQVLTPISSSVITKVVEAGKSIVLVSGKLDTPGWAYTEAMVQKAAFEKLEKRNGDGRTEDDVEEGEEEVGGGDSSVDGREESEGSAPFSGHGFQNVPWVEKLHGSKGRGVEARVWRVRRDLGRTSNGAIE